MHINTFVAAVALFHACNGFPVEAGGNLGVIPRTDKPCKQVRNEVEKWMVDNGIVPRNLSFIEKFLIPTVPAAPIRPSVAFACLKSVPLHKDTALQQLEFLRPLFEWQSSVDNLREPPEGYLSEGVDLLRGLDDIATTLVWRGYANEFEFLSDLHTLAGVRVRDFHFKYETALLNLFTFRMGVQFVSISEDGLSTPKIYLYDDLHHANRGYTPSPVSTIDGVPALDFLQKASVNHGAAHDPDARFNLLFPSAANDANLGHELPETFALHLSDTTKVKCQNGTTLEFTNTAFVRANFTNIASGSDLYQQFGQGNATEPQPLSWGLYALDNKNYTTSLASYPTPLNATKGADVMGFLPDGAEFADVAVLSVNSFVPPISPSDILGGLDVGATLSTEASLNVTVDFIRAAQASGRTKLVLDLQGNTGGFLSNMAALYFTLFPGKLLPVLWQARAHPQLAWLGKELLNTTDPSQLPWYLNNFIKPDGKKWDSFEEFYGPVKRNTGAYTQASLTNISADLNMDAFPNRLPSTIPPFQPSDIIILTDGQCGSACAIFTEILVHAHGVRTIALGGRPLNTPMQAIGMTKGGPTIPFVTFPSEVNRSHVPDNLHIPPPARPYRPPLRVVSSSLVTAWADGIKFNLANMLPFNASADAQPLQFTYEAANCRLFFTWEMARDITAAWKAVADAAWRKGKCVPGSTTNPDGTMGGVPGYTKAVEDQYKLGSGPGAL